MPDISIIAKDVSGSSILKRPSRNIANSTVNILMIGDSNTKKTGTMTKPMVQLISEKLLADRGIICTWKAFGLDGYSWNYTYSNGPLYGQTLTTLLPSQIFSEIDPSMDNWLFASAGSNGMFLGGNSAATEFADVQAFRDVALTKFAPSRFIVETVPPRQDDSSFNTKRLTYNASLIADAASVRYLIADSGAATHLGTSGDEDNTTYFQSDKIHFTDTGNGIRRDLFCALIP